MKNNNTLFIICILLFCLYSYIIYVLYYVQPAQFKIIDNNVKNHIIKNKNITDTLNKKL
jgi:hypothetical protein